MPTRDADALATSEISGFPVPSHQRLDSLSVAAARAYAGCNSFAGKPMVGLGPVC